MLSIIKELRWTKKQLRLAILTKTFLWKLTYYRRKLSKTCVQIYFVQKIRTENGWRLVLERAGAYLHFDAVPLRHGRGTRQVSNRRGSRGWGRKPGIHCIKSVTIRQGLHWSPSTWRRRVGGGVRLMFYMPSIQ